MFNRLRTFWPKGYQRRSFGKSQQQATSSLAQEVEQWTGNRKAAGSNPNERQLFCTACVKVKKVAVRGAFPQAFALVALRPEST